MSETVHVSADLGGQTVGVGTAYFTRRHNSISTAFRYAEAYLSRPGAYAIDPAMPLSAGNHSLVGIPGAFADSSPDRWGKNLISSSIRARAMKEGRTPPLVSDVDYLLGVSDLTRQGALRFRTEEGAAFLGLGSQIPPLLELPRVLHAADAVGRDAEDMEAIRELLDAGSGSLGGARPKASVRDGDTLLIAKFPHRSDEWNVMAWEKVALDLAERAGIATPSRQLVHVGGRGVLLLRRFDRNPHRVAYMSAMTMLQARDGLPGDYVDIAETLTEYGSQTGEDLRRLWRRVAFSIAINNTDDHLRNHGFLRSGAGWRLSPVFDVNPNPDVGAARVTSIGGARGHDALDALLAYADTFRVSQRDAPQILREVLDATAEWRAVAGASGIAPSEIQRFTQAFEGQRAPLESRAA